METQLSRPISDDEVADLLALLDRGRQAWIEGDLGYGPDLDAAQDDDMTIFGPFGGEAGRGPGLPERQQASARLFHGGTGTSEVVKTIVSGQIVVVILVERNTVHVHDTVDQPWVLRTTQVFERRQKGWFRLHRHADPLIDRRTPADTFAIAGGRLPSAPAGQ